MIHLFAFAAPIDAPLLHGVRGEHTYVVSDQGGSWGCAGRAEGGRRLGQGIGDGDLVTCLAQPDGYAGIHYARTGVCHQIANRILWPAKVLVDQAEGYSFSLVFFGHYGRGPWSERDVCCELLGVEHLRAEGRAGMSKRPRPPRESPRELDEPEAAFVTEPTERERFIDDRLAQLDELLGEHLGDGLESGKRARVRQIMVAAAGEQFDLVNAADRGELPADAYLDRFTELLRSTFVDIDRVLGRADFERVFGAGPEHALGIVDPEAYAQAHGLARPPAGGKGGQ